MSTEFACFDLDSVIAQIATAVGANAQQVRAAVELLDAGNTLPFIARYRKEATRGLDETALRAIDDALTAARELAARKQTILKTIDQQGVLTAELRRQIEQCSDKQTLELIYLPFKPKRRTRATIARERGLEPLAELLWKQTRLNRPRHEVLKPYINPAKEVPDAEAALQGACDIVAERWADDVELNQWLAQQAMGFGHVTSTVKRGKKTDGAKFETYFDHRESAKRVPSHRFLAMQRGEAEGFLNVGVQLDDEFTLGKLRPRLAHNRQFEFHDDLLRTVDDCYTRLLLPAVASTTLQTLKERADDEAIGVFAGNLRQLLLAAPAGPQVTIGIDPGFRTGCKIAVVDGTGKYLASTAIYPTAPKNDVEGAGRVLKDLIAKYNVRLIAIGNGTASRETDDFVTGVLKSLGSDVIKAMVSESGASIYSASELAVSEYPDLDVTIRGAISIAHRLQDPLAELVKLDPKSIGVGQYQHDVNQKQLQSALGREVESCVNSVGVDLNLASPALLSYVAGIGPKLAERIVEYRDANGRFDSRAKLLKVPKLGPKAYEQAAGFLRVRQGAEPLDDSAVHPESYGVVARMAKSLSVDLRALVGNAALTSRLQAADFVDKTFGLPTVADIIAELAKPGRDPRSEFRQVKFSDGVNEIGDVRPGMLLDGVVTNVTKFGAFVDVGVHQDALIHISQLANAYINDPSEVVAVGDLVRVKVLEVDVERKRIAVSRKQAMPG
ncbi:Tex family protein [Lacipirellula parvula]|uniref:Transcription accessory protein n=1 Tax=Lacipirellula parvula TaxID=2650471 RepID=A0A5K7X7Q3_9BACT|nr:Tex family protein [Lacipirellula parvula]BBO30761.1 transcription accessory protein [Lacipirellula parvula]